MPYATQVLQQLAAAGIRTELFDQAESMQNRIRKAETAKIPYMLVVGKKEAEAGTVSIRKRGKVDGGVLSVSDFVEQLLEQVAQRG
jgi:threonyl-tRNA synthetase